MLVSGVFFQEILYYCFLRSLLVISFFCVARRFLPLTRAAYPRPALIRNIVRQQIAPSFASITVPILIETQLVLKRGKTGWQSIDECFLRLHEAFRYFSSAVRISPQRLFFRVGWAAPPSPPPPPLLLEGFLM